MNLADDDWEFPRILNNIHHYISLVTSTTPEALPILKEEFYHMVETIKQAVCEIKQTEKADFEPLNKFELAHDAIEHFIELTQTTSNLMTLTTETNSDSKSAFEAAKKLAETAENIASEVYLNGSRERIVNPSVLAIFLNESTKNLYHMSMNHLLFTGDIDSIDKISYIYDQARDIISHSLSHYKTENDAVLIAAPEIHELLTQLATALREVIAKWPIADSEPSATETAAWLKVKNNGESEIGSRCPEPNDVIDKLDRLSTAKQIADAYGLPVKTVRTKLNRAAKKDFDLRTEIADPKARDPKFLYDTKRSKPYMENLKANLKK